MQFRSLIFGLLLSFVAVTSFGFEMRIWTAMNGKTSEAAYVKYESDTQKVVMQKRDGSIIKVDREALSDEDWMYVSQFDESILSFTIFLSEINVRPITPQISEYMTLNMRRAGTLDIHSDQWKSIEKISRTPSITLRFFATDRNLCIVKQGQKIVGFFPIPEQGEDCFLPPHVKTNNQKWNPNSTYKVYQTLDYRDRNSRHYGLYTEWVKWAWYSSGKMTPQPIDYHILAMNNTIWTDTEQYDIPDAIAVQNSVNYKHRFSGVSYYLLDKIASDKVALIAPRVSHHKLALEFYQIQRYKRLKEKSKRLSQGIPQQVTVSPDKKRLGTGSGFFISENGFLLTNYHVVQGANEIQLLSENGIFQASIIRIDPAVDLALLKVSGDNFAPLPFAQEIEASLGDDIFTIGFPMPDIQGFNPKLTKGVISGLKGIRDTDTRYQIDASIQPGNSGGPVVNSQGEMVGMIVSSLREDVVVDLHGALPQNVNFAIKKKFILDFISQVPSCVNALQTRDISPASNRSQAAVVSAVQKSCAMIIAFE